MVKHGRSTEVKEQNKCEKFLLSFGQQIIRDTQYSDLQAMALFEGRLVNFQKLIVRKMFLKLTNHLFKDDIGLRM